MSILLALAESKYIMGCQEAIHEEVVCLFGTCEACGTGICGYATTKRNADLTPAGQ